MYRERRGVVYIAQVLNFSGGVLPKTSPLTSTVRAKIKLFEKLATAPYFLPYALRVTPWKSFTHVGKAFCQKLPLWLRQFVPKSNYFKVGKNALLSLACSSNVANKKRYTNAGGRY